MAFNWQTFRTRASTAVIFVAVMLTGLLWNAWSFLVLFSIIHFGCWWEYFKLLEAIYRTRIHIYTRLGLMLLGYGLMLWFCNETFAIAGYSPDKNFSLPVSIAGFVFVIAGVFKSSQIRLNAFAAAGLGLLYISLSWGLLMHLYGVGVHALYMHVETGMMRTLDMASITVPLVTIASIWINDTMAYIVGSLIGKTPLSKISPKKTWEGTAGGAILCVAVMVLLPPLIFPKHFYPPVTVLTGMIAAVAAVTGTLGDLLESKLKRMAGVKDSGRIMPGHGGFLDRFDSLLVAIPFVWITTLLFVLFL
jgi:phosphatidate cytidylyltransferase